MRNALARIIAGFLLFAVAGHLALGQDAQQKRQAITTRLAVAKTFFDRMPPLQRKALSAGAQNFRNLAENWAEVGMTGLIANHPRYRGSRSDHRGRCLPTLEHVYREA